MAVRDVFKVGRKTFLNPSAWIDLEGLIAQNKTIVDIVKGMSTPPGAGAPETFEDAFKRQGLTEQDVKEGIITYRTMAFGFLVLALGSLLYAGYLMLRHGSFLGTFLSLAVGALFSAQAFKYDFWSLQMRKRQLGLTFADWKRQYLGI